MKKNTNDLPESTKKTVSSLLMSMAITTVSSLMANSLWAEALWPILETKTCAPVVTLSLGPGWAAPGNSETFNLQSDIRKTYNVTSSGEAFPAGELFVGWQMPIGFNLLLQLGVEGEMAHNAQLTGTIWEDANPNFNNYNYSFDVNHSQIAIKGKLLSDVNMVVQPYVSASIGYGNNNAHEFTISPKIFQEIPAPFFTDNSVSALNYAFGIGIQKAINPSFQLGVGYEFANYGKAQLSPAAGQTIGNGLSALHVFTNQLLFSATYVFNEREGRV